MNKNINNIPKEIIEFIEKDEETIVLGNNEIQKILCQKCLNELKRGLKCENCCKDYQFKDSLQYLNHIAFKEKGSEEYLSSITYSYFNVIDNNVFLYVINSNTAFNLNKKTRNLVFEHIYEIKEDGVYDHIKEEQVFNYKSDNIYFRRNSIFSKYVNLYLDNLEILKNTIYKNTNIWLEKEYLNKNNFPRLTLLNLIYAPIYYHNYTYLKDLGLKSLAYLKNFYEMDGTDLIENEIITQHLEFMKKIDIDYPRYIALKETNKENIEFLDKYIENVLYGDESDED